MDWTGMTFKARADERREASRAGRVDRGKRGDMVVWCESCKDFIRLPLGKGYDGTCPACGKPTFKMKCTRCEKEWYPRDPKIMPGTCPRCKSPYFNRTRTRGVKPPKITADPSQLVRVTERMESEEPAEVRI